MASKVKFVKETAQVKIKKEPPDDEEEASVKCRLCDKAFVSETALNNHAKLQHTDAYIKGDPIVWTEQPKVKARQTIKIDPAIVKIRTEALVSSMAPTSLTALAHKDVDYIIIKAPDAEWKTKNANIKMGSDGFHECLEPSLDQPDGVCHETFSTCCDYWQHHRDAHTNKRRRRLCRSCQKELPEPEKRPRGPVPHLKAAKEKKTKTDSNAMEVEIVPPAGPFECVQPSTTTADGICHQMFFSCCEYSLHYLEHTRRRKALRCQLCEKPLLGSGLETQDPYPCDICGEGFLTNMELSAHKSTAHVKLKPFQCQVCQKRFTQQGGLVQHSRLHTGIRPYACTYCPKKFTQKSGLDQHLRIHTNTKPYKCVICSKAFIQAIHLQQHIRIHTNVTPFQCIICDKRFKQGGQLNCHVKTHNTATMSQEQKVKYKNFLQLIRKNIKYTDESESAQVESYAQVDSEELEESEVQEEMETYVMEGDEEEFCVEEVQMDETAEMIREQILAEQSITQVEA